MLTWIIAFSMAGWVVVANPDGVTNANNTFPFGESCVLTTTKGVTTRAELKDKTVYRITQVEGMAAGTVCPVETLFLLSKETFEQWQVKEAAEAQALESLRSAVKKALTP